MEVRIAHGFDARWPVAANFAPTNRCVMDKIEPESEEPNSRLDNPRGGGSVAAFVVSMATRHVSARSILGSIIIRCRRPGHGNGA